MSQVDVPSNAKPVETLMPMAEGNKANTSKQQQNKLKLQKPVHPSQKDAGAKGPKGGKSKGSKTVGPVQPYYQELIMQLTNASEWVQCSAGDAGDAEEARRRSTTLPNKGFQAVSDEALHTMSTSQSKLKVPSDRPKPHRMLSLPSIRSSKSAQSSETTISSESCESSKSSIDTSSSVSSIAPPQIPPKKVRRTPVRRQQRVGANILSLADMDGASSLHALLEQYGGVQHGGILDPSYSFFVNRAGTAAINFIVKDKVAVVGGDPLCDPSLFDLVFAEFATYRKRHGLGLAIFGGSDVLAEYGKRKGWSSIRFGQERVLNPLTNPVLHGKVQKQIIRQNKALLDPERGGNSINIYSPATTGRDMPLESSLSSVYDAWKDAKNASGAPQRYTTVYDPFALPDLMIYIYTRDKHGTPNGFAALRKLGAKGGYYIDPCVAAPGAPSRIPDLLYFTAMGLLNMFGCGYLAIGMEPATSLELSGFPRKFSELAKRTHASLFESLKLEGKREYHSKFRPDESLGSGLHLMFPGGAPGVRRILSVVHFANISIREVVKERWVEQQTKRRVQKREARDREQAERLPKADKCSSSDST